MLNSESFCSKSIRHFRTGRAWLHFEMNMLAIYQFDIVKIAKQRKFVLGILLQPPGILEFYLGGISSRTQVFMSLWPNPLVSENMMLSSLFAWGRQSHFTPSTYSCTHMHLSAQESPFPVSLSGVQLPANNWGSEANDPLGQFHPEAASVLTPSPPLQLLT